MPENCSTRRSRSAWLAPSQPEGRGSMHFVRKQGQTGERTLANSGIAGAHEGTGKVGPINAYNRKDETKEINPTT